MEPSERAVFSCSPLMFSPEIDRFLLGRLDVEKMTELSRLAASAPVKKFVDISLL